MAAISDAKIWQPVFAVVALLVLIFGGFKGRAFVFCLLVALVISTQFLVGPLKTLVDRRRPKQTEVVRMVQLQRTHPAFLTLAQKPTIRFSDERDRRKSGPSFPSGHTANNTIIAVACCLFFPRWGWLYFLVALAVGYSRVYLGAHWPSDVFATIFLAAGETLLVVAFLEWLWRKLAPRFAPNIFARHPHLHRAAA